jgi:hypothetical protein
LDIGGIEVQVGQHIDSVLPRFLANYDIFFHEELRRWFVSNKTGGRTVILGNLEVVRDRVTLVQKVYDYNDDLYKLSEVYSLALRDVQSRSGTTCSVRIHEWPSGGVQSVISTCGRYALTFSLPYKSQDGKEHVSAGISIALH